MNRTTALLWIILCSLSLPHAALADNTGSIAMGSYEDDDLLIEYKAEDLKPLRAGAPAPFGTLRNSEGKSVDLENFLHQKPTILLFYQGSWNPDSNQQLDQWVKLAPKLEALGYQVAAVSPDQPMCLRVTSSRHGITYKLLSDRTMDVTRRFGLAYRASDSVFQKLGVRLEDYTGNSLHALPLPAVYGIDKKGIIRFLFKDVDGNFAKKPEKLLQAAKNAVATP